MNQGLFLDRDGVINHDYGYVHLASDFVFRHEIIPIAQVAKSKGYIIVVVTNQGGIGRGLYDKNAFIAVDEHMKSIFNSYGVVISKTYFCPFHDLHGKGYYKRKSWWRKPSPGMLVDACNDFNINPRFSVMIGDQLTDNLAAQSMGIGRYIDSSLNGWTDTAMRSLDF